jgi:hypothetical protein
MSKIYLRLVKAPAMYWEHEGVLRFESQIREGKRLKAWSVLCGLLNVSSATANKALTWMHEQKIIGYFSGKNGVGLRIFLNRAAASIGIRQAFDSKKNLTFSPVSSAERRASNNETAFKETHGNLEIQDIDNSRAPKDGANIDITCKEPGLTIESNEPLQIPAARVEEENRLMVRASSQSAFVGEVVRQVRAALEPSLRAAAIQAAAREHERTREWLEKRGLPKAARVAQREAYNLLKHHGAIKNSSDRTRSELMVGSHSGSKSGPKLLSKKDFEEAAEICLSMLEAHGQAIDITLAEISTGAGGFLLAEDASRVREIANSMARARTRKE